MIQQFTRFVALPVLVCSMLTQCAWFIPAEKSVPRYNKVVGETRRPELNPANGMAPPPSPSSDAQSFKTAYDYAPAAVAAAPVAPVAVASSAYPPVSAETKSQANEIVTRDVPPPAVLQSSPDGMRRTPAENMTTAQNTYPSLNSIPQGPAVTDPDAVDRLQRVRAQLEQERAVANGQRIQLGTDAAAQPSLLSNPVENPAVQPAPMPYSAPSVTIPRGNSSSLLPPPLPLASAADMNRYVPQAVPSVSAPVPNIGVSSNQSFAISPTPQNFAAPMQEPILLRPPAAVAMAPSSVSDMPVVSYGTSSMAPAASGGFNPLAGAADSSKNYANESYLAPSRYAPRRGY